MSGVVPLGISPGGLASDGMLKLLRHLAAFQHRPAQPLRPPSITVGNAGGAATRDEFKSLLVSKP